MATTALHFDDDTGNEPSNIRLRDTPTSISSIPSTASPVSDSSTLSINEPPSHSNYPHGSKSLSGISLRAFLLGVALGISSILTCILLPFHRVWRAPFFLSTLSLFHFLEYYLTARYNTPYANISAFLLSRNGRAYNAAHTGAVLECIIGSFLIPQWQQRLSNIYIIPLGLTLIVVGQATRSGAMAQAGTNFNHTVQTKRNEGHILVTTGIYAWLRHPSYFGFFWWGLGTQLVLGNVVCFLVYAAVLWAFFKSRIRKEESLLVEFFGQEYQDYRAKTTVGIPLIR